MKNCWTFNWLEIEIVKHRGVQVNLLYLKMCKEIWETAVGEDFVCARGPLYSHDCSSCMWKEKELPRMLSRPCSLLRWGGVSLKYTCVSESTSLLACLISTYTSSYLASYMHKHMCYFWTVVVVIVTCNFCSFLSVQNIPTLKLSQLRYISCDWQTLPVA